MSAATPPEQTALGQFRALVMADSGLAEMLNREVEIGRFAERAANGMRRADVEHLKSFLSRQRDRARMAYDRTMTELLRQCIVVGTTNHKKYLRDLTGNRSRARRRFTSSNKVCLCRYAGL